MRYVKTCSVTILALLLLSAFAGLMVAPGSPVGEASASTTGSLYSGTGNWAITTPTIYTNETLVVRGNIELTGSGTLTLINTHLTVDVPTGGLRYINVSTAGGGCWVRAQTGSIIDTTNYTAGVHNLKITTDNSGYIQFDNTTIKNTWIYQTGTVKDYINNCTLDQCRISAYYARSWSMYGCTWQGSTITNAIVLGTGSKISHCTFRNWTVPGTSILTDRLIYSVNSNNIRIDNNTWEPTSYPIMWLSGNPGTELKSLLFDGNTIRGISNVTGFYFDSQVGSTSVVIKNNVVEAVTKGTGFKVGHHCQVLDNHFVSIDASSAPYAIAGITFEGTIRGVLIDGNIFDSIVGPPTDVGGTGNGIFTYLGGNFTASNNTFYSISSVANGICISAGSGTNTVIENNHIYNVTEASDGIGVYGGSGVIVRYNTIEAVDLSSCGIRLALKGINPHIYENSVNSLIETTNKVQTSSGAYSINGEAYGVQGATFENNTVGWLTTAQYPGYNITGTQSTTAEIYPLGKSAVVFKNAAVTISYTGSSLWINDVTAGTTTTYPNGTDSVVFASEASSRTLIVEAPVYAPEFTSAPILKIAEGSTYSYQAYAGSSSISWSVSGADFLAISVNGLVSGIPDIADIGSHSISIEARNPYGVAFQNFTLEVEARAIISVPVTVGHVGEAYQYQVVSRYPALNYSITGPDWLSISDTGLITGTPPDGAVGRYAVTVTVETANQTAVQTYTLEVKGAPITAENLDDTLVPIAVGVLVLAVLLASLAALVGKVNILLPRRPRP